MRGRWYFIFLSFADNGIAADYLNYKSGLGPAKIYCILADKRERRFFEVDFEQNPYKVWKSKDTCFITATEGTSDFLIQVKQGEFYLGSKYLTSSVWCSAFFPCCCRTSVAFNLIWKSLQSKPSKG